MSERHLSEIDALIQLCRTACEQVKEGQLSALESFEKPFDKAFERLSELGDVHGAEDVRMAVRRRLRDLDKTRLEFANELLDLRQQMAGRLRGVTRGRKGLTAYRRTVGGPNRGALRGQG